MPSYRFKTNINCGNCIKSVTPNLNNLDNVDFWKVDTSSDDKILEVELDDENQELVIEAVKSAGFKIEKVNSL